jgi:DNA gyrase subunit A
MDAYRTGRGSIKMRATARSRRPSAAAGRSSSPSCRTRRAARRSPAGSRSSVDSGELEGISDVNDGSSGGKTSLVVSLKRDANPNVVLNNLYKLTQLQTSFGVNMVALVDGVPRTLNLVDALNGYIRHQVEVITRAASSASTARADARTSSRAG